MKRSFAIRPGSSWITWVGQRQLSMSSADARPSPPWRRLRAAPRMPTSGSVGNVQRGAGRSTTRASVGASTSPTREWAMSLMTATLALTSDGLRIAREDQAATCRTRRRPALPWPAARPPSDAHGAAPARSRASPPSRPWPHRSCARCARRSVRRHRRSAPAAGSGRCRPSRPAARHSRPRARAPRARPRRRPMRGG